MTSFVNITKAPQEQCRAWGDFYDIHKALISLDESHFLNFS